MQITLCEDDGIFHNGVPTMVVLVVEFDDGKKKRIPYAADRSISTLYEDIKNIAPQVSQGPTQNMIDFIQGNDPITHKPRDNRPLDERFDEAKKSLESRRMMPSEDKSNVIEKEDIVSLVMLDPGRDKDATCNLTVGQELRVIKIHAVGVTLPGQDKITQIVQGYDVVNAVGEDLERTRVYPQEVKLLRKRTTPIIPKNNVISEILPCPSCQAPNALGLDGSSFKGTCTDCKQDIEIARIIKKCQTEKCGRDVSCFDVGGKYQGKCNQCQSSIEVPYA